MEVEVALDLDQSAKVIEQVLGPRCAEFDPNCCTCIAWALLQIVRERHTLTVAGS